MFYKDCPFVVDCEWSEWHYGQCSKSCGIDTQFLQRGVQVRAQNGGKPCVGESTRTENCNYHACPAFLPGIEIYKIKLRIFLQFRKSCNSRKSR